MFGKPVNKAALALLSPLVARVRNSSIWPVRGNQPANRACGPAGGSQAPAVISMSKACKWAYPGQATGRTQGSAYAIVCLGKNGQVLGGFGGSHSLNAWCADPSHTNGRNLPAPALVDGAWRCTPSGPSSGTTGSPSPSRSPTPRRGPSSVLIPMSSACKWAYPGLATGRTQGSAYSIVCLGKNGQVLGGFGGSHSLNAWCADPSHTNGWKLPNPALIKSAWKCTR